MALALGATVFGCSDPVASTDLRPEGDPEVLSVLVMNDAEGQFLESAAFCAVGDNKRPGFVGTPVGGVDVCDPVDLNKPADPVTDAVPTAWYARIMFDELLDPNIEELLPILSCAITGGGCADDTDCDPGNANDKCVVSDTSTGSLLNTQPVVLKCGGAVVAYDGYYSPSGNNVTWPLGPSLFIKPIDLSTVASGSECTIEIKDVVTDKDGNTVPTAQRGTGGEYKFSLSGLEFVSSSPAPAAMPGDEEIITADAPLVLTFNGFIDPTTLAGGLAGEVTVEEVADCTAAAGSGVKKSAVVALDPNDLTGTSIDVTISGAAVACPGAMMGDPDVACAFNPNKGYIVTFSATNAVADVAGGPGSITSDPICFTVEAP